MKFTFSFTAGRETALCMVHCYFLNMSLSMHCGRSCSQYCYEQFAYTMGNPICVCHAFFVCFCFVLVFPFDGKGEIYLHFTYSENSTW